MLSDEKLNDAYEAAVMRGVSHADGLRGVAMAVVRAERDGAKKSFDIRCPACNGKGYGGEEDGCSNCSDTGFVTASLFIYNPEVGAEFWMAKAHQYDCERQELSAQLDAVRAEREGAAPVAFLIDWPDEPGLGHYFAEASCETGRSRPLYLHPPQASATVPEGYRLQPLSEFDAMLNTRTVPDGWKLVPVVPTEEMLIASMRGVDYGTGVGLEHKKKLSSRQWKAMLAAAPSRPGDEPSAHQVVVENVVAFNGDIPMPGDGEAQR